MTRYGIPRHLDVPEQLLPFVSAAQLASTAFGVGVAGWIALAAPLPWEVKAWPVLWFPVLGLLATRRLPFAGGRWTGLELAGA